MFGNEFLVISIIKRPYYQPNSGRMLGNEFIVISIIKRLYYQPNSGRMLSNEFLVISTKRGYIISLTRAVCLVMSFQ